MNDVPRFTVIIPAHNEEAVIARCLDSIRRDAPSARDMEIILAANGCTDRTVERALASMPDLRVIELPEGSKTAAINAANRVASYYPRIVLDADIECDFRTLAALAEALQEHGVMVASPAFRLVLDDCGPLVKAYFKVWEQMPFAKSGNGGAGCYGLSQAACEQLGEFPPIIGDDIWVHTRFAPERKRLVSHDRDGHPVFTLVRQPRSALKQIGVEARRQIGNREVLRDYPSHHAIAPGSALTLGKVMATRASLADKAVFIAMKLAARALARWRQWRGAAREWTSDHSSRRKIA